MPSQSTEWPRAAAISQARVMMARFAGIAPLPAVVPEFREAEGIKFLHHVVDSEAPGQGPGRGQLSRHGVGSGEGDGGQPRPQGLRCRSQEETGIQSPGEQQGGPMVAPEVSIQGFNHPFSRICAKRRGDPPGRPSVNSVSGF